MKLSSRVSDERPIKVDRQFIRQLNVVDDNTFVLNVQWLIVTDGKKTETIYALDLDNYSSLFVRWIPYFIFFAALVGATNLTGLLDRLLDRLFLKIFFSYGGFLSDFDSELINLA